jgi:hypothetical protein
MAPRKSCRGRAMTRDQQINCSVLLLNPWPEREHWSVPKDIQRGALDEIATQIFEYVEEALKQRDPWAAASIMAKGEKVIATYTAEKFDQLLPLQQALQATLHTFWRMARRRFIRAALRAPAYEYELYQQDFKSGMFDGEDALEDWHAVEAHLDEGRALFNDLHRRSKLKVVG